MTDAARRLPPIANTRLAPGDPLDDYQLVVTLNAKSLPLAAKMLEQVAQLMSRARSPKDFPQSGGAGDGTTRWAVTCNNPPLLRIEALRAEADRLEKELKTEKEPAA